MPDNITSPYTESKEYLALCDCITRELSWQAEELWRKYCELNDQWHEINRSLHSCTQANIYAGLDNQKRAIETELTTISMLLDGTLFPDPE